MKITKHIQLIAVLISPVALCSATKENAIYISICAFTDAIEWHDANGVDISSNQTPAGGSGHCYLTFESMSPSPKQIGYWTLSPYSKLTVGLWSTSGIGSSIVSGNENNSLHSGIIYGYESCFYNYYEQIQNQVLLKRTISDAKLSSVSSLIQQKNNTYSLVFYNCATFACDVWNTAFDEDFPTTWFLQPQAVMDTIENETGYQTSNYVPNASIFVQYDNGNFNYYGLN